MDHFESLFNSSRAALPFVTLLIGLAGSTHCMGMCGAISLSCSNTNSENRYYQFGRLNGYLFLALIASVLGKVFNLDFFGQNVSIFSSIFIGGGLIYIGLKTYFSGKVKSELKIPKLLNNKFISLWSKLLSKKSKDKKTIYAIGFISILLPCGLLYSVIIPLVALDSYVLSLICIFSFWLGTLPVMSFAPIIIQKILKPLSLKAPLLTSIVLIFLGVSTIGMRLLKTTNLPSKSIEAKICH